MKIKDVDKTLVASVALHVLVLGWAMVSVSTKALEMPPEDSVPVDVISSDQLAKVMAGMKTGKKENPKPLVEKVAEAKPVDDAVGQLTDKAPVVTETAPPPQPKEWNLWDLERRAREQAGNAPRDEEWSALFTHLRVFANADGRLPKEFDELVRESFGELIEAA